MIVGLLAQGPGDEFVPIVTLETVRRLPHDQPLDNRRRIGPGHALASLDRQALLVVIIDFR